MDRILRESWSKTSTGNTEIGNGREQRDFDDILETDAPQKQCSDVNTEIHMTVDGREHGNTPPEEITIIGEASDQKLLECTLSQEKSKRSGCRQITPRSRSRSRAPDSDRGTINTKQNKTGYTCKVRTLNINGTHSETKTYWTIPYGIMTLHFRKRWRISVRDRV